MGASRTATAAAAPPSISIGRPRSSADLATLLGLVIAFALIGVAIWLSGNLLSFADGPSVLIVVFGTVAVTMVSYTLGDMATLPVVLARSMLRQNHDPREVGMAVLKLAELVRRGGPVALEQVIPQLGGRRLMQQAALLITDQVPDHEVEATLMQEAASIVQRHARGVAILRRAADVAPAMGLIGTLIGLVGMLANLKDPLSIGPNMAVALLTTFYGALMGSVILSPLAGKLERLSADENLANRLIILGAVSMARQENPRRLELLLNTILPPHQRLKYFD